MTSHITADIGKEHLLATHEVETTTEAQRFHMESKDRMCNDWTQYQDMVDEIDWDSISAFVKVIISESFLDEKGYNKQFRVARQQIKISPSKPQIIKVYSKMKEAGEVAPHMVFESLFLKKTVRSNSGVVVITLVTSPGPFSCPNDCHYCPSEPGQPKSYLSTEPAVLRANQNEFDPVRQFYDRASTLAKQGHAVDKIELIVLGGTWSAYPRDYQEQFCRDAFYAANTFNDELVRAGTAYEDCVEKRERLSILEEQRINEHASTKIIGVTLETRPDHINLHELRRLRTLGCTRVQLGVQHTDNQILDYINRGHYVEHAVKAVKLLKTHGFKVDIHLMPDLPGTTVEKDYQMFDYVLDSPDLQADHWKIYPCEVTPFTRIEEWYRDGSYMPYTEVDPQKLVDLLVHVKAKVWPWIRLNRVIRDIPEVSIIAGNANTNLRQDIFKKLEEKGLACRCIRCREVRDWPESPEALSIRVREYRSSDGQEYFISMEGGDRGLGGGATGRGLTNSKPSRKQRRKDKREGNGRVPWRCRPTLYMRAERVVLQYLERWQRKAVKLASKMKALVVPPPENPTLYGLLRLRFNDDPAAPAKAFPELRNCALIRELHVYGQVVAARTAKNEEGRPQHKGIGRQLMEKAEEMAIERGFRKIAVIAGVGVRNYYRKLGYELRGDGQYLIKDLPQKAPRRFPVEYAIGLGAMLVVGAFAFRKSL